MHRFNAENAKKVFKMDVPVASVKKIGERTNFKLVRPMGNKNGFPLSVSWSGVRQLVQLRQIKGYKVMPC